MRIVLVANAASGAFAGGVTPDAIRARLRASGLDLAPEPDETLPLPDRLRAALRTQGVAAVAVAGGGTARSTARPACSRAAAWRLASCPSAP